MLPWTDSDSGVSFYVYRGTSRGEESSVPICGGAVIGSSYVDSVPAGTYYYVVRAVSGGNVSPPSNEQEVNVR